MVVACSLPRALSEEEIVRETDKDEELKYLKTIIKKGNFGEFPASLKDFKNVFDELGYTSNGLILRNN